MTDSDKQRLMAMLATQYTTAADLKAAGYSAADLKAAGYSAADLKAALTAAGYSAAALVAAEQEWASIPILEKPYSRLLAEIQSRVRSHDQSTFGPDCDPETNLCKTPMCTAGHLVNMAGPAGYELRKKYGWPAAAGIIHRKNRPDVEPQNFGSIPQAFALAYIAERAAEEQAEGFEERLAKIRAEQVERE